MLGKTRTSIVQISVLLLMLVLPSKPQTGVYEYYMDSHAQCGKTFELGTNSARVVGHGQVQSSASPTSCTITLSTDGLKEQRVFKVEVAAAQITDTDVTFYIYDGQSTSGGARPLDQFSYNKAPGPNYRPLITSGGFVTFYLKKQQSANYGFNIDIFVTSIAGSVPNPDQCENGQGYGCTAFYNYNPLLTKEQITGIVGGLFGVVVFVIVPIVLIWCYCKQKGVTRRWEEYSLKGVGNTAASINGSSVAKEPWSSQTSRQPFASIRKSPQLPRSKISRPSDSEDSLFLEDSPPRNPPPPPPYSEVDHRFDRFEHRSRGRRYDDDRSSRYEREERKRNPENRRPKYRYGDAAENSYVQTDDDHPQEDFVEKIITPRVKPKSAGRVKKGSDEDDDPYDSIKETKKRRNKKKSKSDSEEDKTESEAEDSVEERNTESEYETSEEESESEDEKENDKKALYAQSSKAKKKGSKPDKRKQHEPVASQPMPVAQPPLGHPLPPGQPPQGVQSGMMMRPPYQAGYPPRGLPVHPAVPLRPTGPGGQQPPFLHPGVVRPVFSGQRMPNQPFQPVRYQHPPQRLAGLPQDQSHFRPSQHPKSTHNAPRPKQPDFSTQNTPTFSHLVQRGYETGRRSPDSLHTDNSYRSQRSDVMRLEDSDGGHDLGSGVELMRRTTDV